MAHRNTSLSRVKVRESESGTKVRNIESDLLQEQIQHLQQKVQVQQEQLDDKIQEGQLAEEDWGLEKQALENVLLKTREQMKSKQQVGEIPYGMGGGGGEGGVGEEGGWGRGRGGGVGCRVICLEKQVLDNELLRKMVQMKLKQQIGKIPDGMGGGGREFVGMGLGGGVIREGEVEVEGEGWRDARGSFRGGGVGDNLLQRGRVIWCLHRDCDGE